MRKHLRPPPNPAARKLLDILFDDDLSAPQKQQRIQQAITFRFYFKLIIYRIRRAVWRWRSERLRD